MKTQILGASSWIGMSIVVSIAILKTEMYPLLWFMLFPFFQSVIMARIGGDANE